MKIGLVTEVEALLKGMESEKAYQKAIEILKSQGAEFVHVSLPSFKMALPCYYIIAPAEATSNLGRFDGIKYSKRAEGKDINETYTKSRSAGFGKEVKRRIKMRGAENNEQILARFKTAYNEINQVNNYNYVVVNDDVEEAVKKVESILVSEKLRVDRIEEIFVENQEEIIHEFLIEKEFVNEERDI